MDVRLCPACGTNELPPRCRKCEACVAVKADPVDAQVLTLMTRQKDARASVPVGWDVMAQLATLREARALGAIDDVESRRLGSLLLMAGCPDAFAGA